MLLVNKLCESCGCRQYDEARRLLQTAVDIQASPMALCALATLERRCLWACRFLSGRLSFF